MKVKVVRSPQRRKTVSARVIGELLEVRIPAQFSAKEEKKWLERMVKWGQAHKAKEELNGEGDLWRRAQELNRRYFNGKPELKSVEYVTNQNRRYGSCTPRNGTIRISQSVAGMPAWVRDYVLVHELAHLVEANHSKAFWKLVNRYKLAERSRGFLIARGMDEATDEVDE